MRKDRNLLALAGLLRTLALAFGVNLRSERTTTGMVSGLLDYYVLQYGRESVSGHGCMGMFGCRREKGKGR